MEKKMKNKYFNQALSHFVHDVASGGAIRHLADSGYTVEQIAEKLSYPITKEQIGKTVWNHYMENGIILLKEPSGEPVLEKITYIKEYGKYGRVHFRQVKEQVENPVKKYLPCDFGKMKYQDEKGFMEKLEGLWARDKEYITGLPWPLVRVYHVADERMVRIFEMLK